MDKKSVYCSVTPGGTPKEIQLRYTRKTSFLGDHQCPQKSGKRTKHGTVTP